MEQCKQEGNISGLQTAVESIEKSLDRLNDGQERFITILEKISVQGEKLQHLEMGFNLLFERVRKIEIRAEGERVKTGAIMAGISIITSAVTAAVATQFWR